MLGKLYNQINRTSRSGTNAEKTDNVGVGDFLEELIFGEEVVQLRLPRVILERFHRDRGVPYKSALTSELKAKQTHLIAPRCLAP